MVKSMTNEELIQAGDMSALWDSLYRFTYQQAYRFYTVYNERCISAGLTVDDLIQESFIIMCDAVRLYKPDTFMFSTYYGSSLKHGFLKLIRKSKSVDSLDKPINDDGTGTLADIMPDPLAEADIDDVIQNLYQRELARDIRIVLDTLPELERNVIYERFWNNATFNTIADKYNLSPEIVQSIEAKALRSLRSYKITPLLYKYVCEV